MVVPRMAGGTCFVRTLSDGHCAAIIPTGDGRHGNCTARLASFVYQIEFRPQALDDLKLLRKTEQRQILASVETQLSQQPTVETRNRKRLRPNLTAEWELRVGQLRVFYIVDEQQLIVRIEAVGIKVGNLLFLRGIKRTL